jgi:hypothetical protein
VCESESDGIAVDYSFAQRGPNFEIRSIGRLTKAEVLAFWDIMEKQPGYAEASGMIVVLHALWWEMTKEEVEELAAMGERFRPVRWAFITHEDLSFGLVEAFTTALCGLATMRVFKEESEALAWLSGKS